MQGKGLRFRCLPIGSAFSVEGKSKHVSYEQLHKPTVHFEDDEIFAKRDDAALSRD